MLTMLKNRPLRPSAVLRAAVLLACVVAGLAVVPAGAQAPGPTPTSPSRPTAVPPTQSYLSWWVVSHLPTDVWSGPNASALSFGPAPVGTPFRVLAPQVGARLYVYNPRTDNVGWVDARAVGPIAAPTDDEIAALIAPPPPTFQPWWAMTHRPAVAWSSPNADAAPFNRIPQWRYLEVVSPEESGRVLTVDPRNAAYAYVETAALGAVGRPPENYFLAPPPDDETLALPGRVVGAGVDSYERPDRVDYFSVDRLEHNTPVTIQGIVDRGEAGTWYRIGQASYVPADRVNVPRVPDRTFPGRWIDANLSEPVLVTAYEDDVPVYAALAVKGTVAFQTPTGVFRVLRRVQSETMDSATIGIPRDAPGGYFLRDVLFTQYFTPDGAALHYNYWRSNWGYAGSHGCMGMNYDDSKFFWDFANLGTVVYAHH